MVLSLMSNCMWEGTSWQGVSIPTAANRRRMGAGPKTAIMKTNVRRQKGIALILAGTFPGLGQLYNRQLLKGVLFLAAGAVLSWLVARAVPIDPLALIEQGVSLTTVLAVVVLLAVWLWSLVDAWRAAGR
jgi:hypothetical protein